METGLLWLFLFIALGIGWVLGVMSKPKAKKEELTYQPPQNIKHRLQLLFDSYSDQSIDQFVQALEVTPDTVGLHISIGKHFRTSGEVEKAILVHQNIMAHPGLSQASSDPVIYELAKDYKAAGLFDRAESLLHQLKKSKHFSHKSQTLLLDIFEREKEWQNALDVALDMDLRKNPDVALRAAYYCCEIALEKKDANDLFEARRCYKKALGLARNCVRAHVELAELEIAQQNYKAAIASLKKVGDTDPQSITIALPLLLECTKQMGSFEQHRAYLNKMYRQTGQVPILLAIVDSLVSEGKVDEALEMLEVELAKEPNVSLLSALLSQTGASEDLSSDTQEKIRRVIEGIQSEKNAYQCVQCGFSGKHMHWICPSCKGWQTIKPALEYVSQDRA